MRFLLLICVCLLPGCKRELQSHEPCRSLPTSVGDWKSIEATSDECGIECRDRIHAEYRRFEHGGKSILASLGTGQFPYLVMGYTLSTRHTPVYYDSIRSAPTSKVLRGKDGTTIEITTLECDRISNDKRTSVVLYWSFWDGVRWTSPSIGDELESLWDRPGPVSKLYVIAPMDVQADDVCEFLIGLCEQHVLE